MLNEELLFKEDVILTWMRDRFLRNLVSEERRSVKTDLKESLSRLRLNPYYTFPALALLEPAARFEDEHERMLDMERMRDYLQQQLTDGSIVFLDEAGRLGLLFSWVSKERLPKIQAMLSNRFQQPFNIGVGKPCSHLYDIRHSYRQAAIALQYKFYRGTGKIIYESELGRYETLPGYPADKEKELYDAFKASEGGADIENAVRLFYEFVLAKGPVDIQSVYDLTVRLLVSLEKRALAETENVSPYERFDVMSIVKLATLEEIKQYVIRFLAGLKDVLSHNQKESHRSIIKKTILHMEQECRYASLQSVAQKVYMTPTYLSLLFKTNTGKTFIEHLTDIRINKAKDMLRSTHYKNYEVAEKVGYQDPRYFSQIFKKKVGLSPSEYRESVSK
ncbi:helix-turn-helix domain-containing protein [Paenibacillus arenilitoris]|uniref:Helix-turn-helix domain-containing protein n=1 Tax=Paenibacillus arenilitoris TaxID=2772299 RepID=A0A927CLT1_9BACL|nr:helix-turn-helix domain-containing protein [Paenibacillus arenilitoris]MBD2869904.1 helix-turn-helix domain-containing protein [Paenibacillus arenilitoris]